MKKIFILSIFFITILVSCTDNVYQVYIKNNTSRAITYTLEIKGGTDSGNHTHTVQPFNENIHDLHTLADCKMRSYNCTLRESVVCKTELYSGVYTFDEINPIEIEVKNMLNENILLYANGYILNEPLTLLATEAGKTGQVITRTPVFSATTLSGYPVLVTSTFINNKVKVLVH